MRSPSAGRERGVVEDYFLGGPPGTIWVKLAVLEQKQRPKPYMISI